jgi:hypothetical protein
MEGLQTRVRRLKKFIEWTKLSFIYIWLLFFLKYNINNMINTNIMK